MVWPERIRKSWLEFRQDKEFRERERVETIRGLYKEVKEAEQYVEKVISYWTTQEKGLELRTKLYKKEPHLLHEAIWPDFKLQLSQLEKAISELHNLERLLDEARSAEVK